MAKLWSQTTDRSRATKRQERIKGSGSWGKQQRQLEKVKRAETRQARGKSPMWGAQTASLDRQRRKEEKQIRRSRPLLHRILGTRSK
jgi:hypothetical protein